MNARTEVFEVSLQLHRREQNINAHISPAPFSAADVQIADRLQMIALCVLAELVGEALWGQWVFCVVLTPPLIGCIQIFGAGFIIGLERHITLRIEKVQNVVSIPNCGTKHQKGGEGKWIQRGQGNYLATVPNTAF